MPATIPSGCGLNMSLARSLARQARGGGEAGVAVQGFGRSATTAGPTPSAAANRIFVAYGLTCGRSMAR